MTNKHITTLNSVNSISIVDPYYDGEQAEKCGMLNIPVKQGDYSCDVELDDDSSIISASITNTDSDTQNFQEKHWITIDSEFSGFFTKRQDIPQKEWDKLISILQKPTDFAKKISNPYIKGFIIHKKSTVAELTVSKQNDEITSLKIIY